MKTTRHSEFGKIKSLFIKRPEQSFVSEAQLELYWKDLNYLSKPDFQKAREEYKVFETLIHQGGAEILYLPEDDTVNIDSIYCRDAAIATDHGMIICNMGKVERKNEPAAELRAFEANKVSVLGAIREPGTIEGGDVTWLDDKTLAVGQTYRTNQEGIRQLRSLLEPLGITIIEVPLPHYRGPSDVFHLMSILSPVDRNIAVIYSPLMPIVFRNSLLEKGFTLVEVPDQEFDSMGCNVLALAPGKCLMVAGNPITRQGLKKAGCSVIEYEGEEISVKGGGGPTCLTRPIDRFID